MTAFIDAHAHYFAAVPDAIAHWRRLLASSAIRRVCVGTCDLGLEHSDAFPMMSTVFSTTNDQWAEALAELNSSKIAPFFYVDPREKTAAREVERRAGDGARGFEMYPPVGWYPDESRVRPAFEAAEALGLPVFLHMGRTASHPGLRSKYAQPIHLEDLGLACPGLKLVLGHFAAPWSREACQIALGFPHWRFDLMTSGVWQKEDVLYCVNRPDLGVDRLLLGSNGDGRNNLHNLNASVSILRGYGFTDEQLDAVTHGNAAAFFGV